MRKKAHLACLAAVWAFACCALHAGILDDERILARGDANGDGVVNGSDASWILNYLYHGGPAPPCMNQADTNDSGTVTQADAVYLLSWLYNGGPAPPYPGPFGTFCVADGYPYPGCASLDC